MNLCNLRGKLRTSESAKGIGVRLLDMAINQMADWSSVEPADGSDANSFVGELGTQLVKAQRRPETQFPSERQRFLEMKRILVDVPEAAPILTGLPTSAITSKPPRIVGDMITVANLEATNLYQTSEEWKNDIYPKDENPPFLLPQKDLAKYD